MKILIPTAKQLSTVTPTTSDIMPLLDNTKRIIATMSQLSLEALQQLYHSSQDVSQQAQKQWQSLQSDVVLGESAINLFDGLMYRHMQRDKWTEEDIAYVREYVWITSALYGVIPSDAVIAPYRLDFQQKLVINHATLTQLWREQYDASVSQETEVLSLLSSEFEQVFSPHIREKFIKVTFIENGKIHATISKKARGALVYEAVKSRVCSIEDIKRLTVNGFCYNDTASTEKNWVFEKMI